jgi:hypothetical protein
MERLVLRDKYLQNGGHIANFVRLEKISQGNNFQNWIASSAVGITGSSSNFPFNIVLHFN